MLNPIVVLLLLAPLTERENTTILAKRYGYQSEVTMPDGTRCDLISPTHAIEVEWSDKWKEAPAQATLYSIWTGKRPGIVLLRRGGESSKLDILRCRLVCERLGIDMQVVDP